MTAENLPRFILSGYALNGDGGAKKLDEENEILSVLKSKDLGWVHLDATHEGLYTWLNEHFDYLDESIIEAMTAVETRPRIAEIGEGYLLNLRGVNLNPGADPEDMVSIRMYVDPYRILTAQRRDLIAVEDIIERLELGKGPKNAGEVMIQLMLRLFQRMEPVITDLDDKTDLLEARILHDPDAKLRKDIVDVRQDAIMLRRYIAPQKDIPAFLRMADVPWISSQHKRSFQDAQDRVLRYVEDLDSIRERSQIVKDELTNALADRMNKNIYVLSLITAIFLPLGFMTGLLGINVGGMPGADNDMAFWYVCAMCVGVMAFATIVMKFLKWV